MIDKLRQRLRKKAEEEYSWVEIKTERKELVDCRVNEMEDEIIEVLSSSDVLNFLRKLIQD